MMKKILILIGFILPLQIFGQVWVARYNGSVSDMGAYDVAFAMTVDDSGYIYVTGETYGDTAESNYMTIKYNSAGDTMWVRKYDGPDNSQDVAYAIAVDKNGNVYVTGKSYGNGTWYDYATVKYNSLGNVIWERRYDSGGGTGNKLDEASAIAVDEIGNVYVTGRGVGGYITVKYDSLGVEKWVRKYSGDGSGTQWAYAITTDNSGNVYVTGVSSGAAATLDYATIKYNILGDTVWVRRYNGTKGCEEPKGYDYDKTKGFARGGGAAAIAVDNSENVYVTGCSYGGYATTIKYNGSGDTVWVRKYHSPDSTSGSEGTALALDNIGNVYITGRVGYDSAKTSDYVTIKYNSVGDTIWVRRYNGTGDSIDVARGIAVDNSGNVYVTGNSWGTYPDYATVKYNSSGNEEWVQRYNGPGNEEDQAYAIALDKNNWYVYVTGISYGEYNFDYATIKYSCVGIEETSNLDFRFRNADLRIIKDKIYLEVPKSINAELKIYDLSGRIKETVYKGALSKGDYVFTPKVKKNGVYFVTLKTGEYKETKKLILMK
ncbi:MAG: SBBP repeat-containing protein [bacterium]|nr:SBBP repeat-containing protein [bacterium]